MGYPLADVLKLINSAFIMHSAFSLLIPLIHAAFWWFAVCFHSIHQSIINWIQWLKTFNQRMKFIEDWLDWEWNKLRQIIIITVSISGFSLINLNPSRHSIINEINWMSSVWFQLINELRLDLIELNKPEIRRRNLVAESTNVIHFGKWMKFGWFQDMRTHN